MRKNRSYTTYCTNKKNEKTQTDPEPGDNVMYLIMLGENRSLKLLLLLPPGKATDRFPLSVTSKKKSKIEDFHFHFTTYFYCICRVVRILYHQTINCFNFCRTPLMLLIQSQWINTNIINQEITNVLQWWDFSRKMTESHRLNGA